MSYPATHVERDRFVLDHRGSRVQLDPWRHQGVLVEAEPTEMGEIVDVATIFLTGRECPWRCVMCDLWRYTTPSDTPPGAIPKQIADAVAAMHADRGTLPPQVKLYNAGSFFDPRAVPPQDDDAIVGELTAFDRVIVESHPSLVDRRTWRLRDALEARRAPSRAPTLEVAMGLETAHPDALDRLHKRLTLERFRHSAGQLRSHGVALRVFVLVNPPFIPAADQDAWLRQSVDFAFDCGATVVSLIPTRPGNGAMEELSRLGLFVVPRLRDVERAAASALARTRGRVFADLWDLDRFADCTACIDARRSRLRRMNLEQRVVAPVTCSTCGEVTPA
jgi:radical SAM enzyme (TIGR01210 family)